MHHLFIQSISETTYTNRVRQTTGKCYDTNIYNWAQFSTVRITIQFNTWIQWYTQSVFFMPECSIGDYREQSLERASVYCFAEYDTG